MGNTQYSKEQILGMVNLGREVCFDITNLQLAFGFKRMAGEEIMLRQLISSKTEEQMQMLSPMELVDNFEKWCRMVGISYGYDFRTNRYFLKKMNTNVCGN